MPSGVAAKTMPRRGEGPEPDGDSAVQVFATALKPYMSLNKPVVGGAGRAHVSFHAQEQAQRAVAGALWPQVRRVAGRSQACQATSSSQSLTQAGSTLQSVVEWAVWATAA
jgi:hypothetical protein